MGTWLQWREMKREHEDQAVAERVKSWIDTGNLRNPESEVYLENVETLPSVGLPAVRLFSLVQTSPQ